LKKLWIKAFEVIELRHNRGARVPMPELEDAAHVFEAQRVVECEVARRLDGRLTPAQLQSLGDLAEAILLLGKFHHAPTWMHGTLVFGRPLNGLLPTTSLLLARFKVEGSQVCVAYRHVDLISALARGPAPAATEMRKHLAELERSMVDTPVQGRSLPCEFSRYRLLPPQEIP